MTESRSRPKPNPPLDSRRHLESAIAQVHFPPALTAEPPILRKSGIRLGFDQDQRAQLVHAVKYIECRAKARLAKQGGETAKGADLSRR
jgi:hypothetical protein